MRRMMNANYSEQFSLKGQWQKAGDTEPSPLKMWEVVYHPVPDNYFFFKSKCVKLNRKDNSFKRVSELSPTCEVCEGVTTEGPSIVVTAMGVKVYRVYAHTQ